jgi:hypothetical protein
MRAKFLFIIGFLICLGYLSISPVREAEAQSGCSFSLSRNGDSFPGTTITGTVTLTASDASCGWTATGIPSWVTGFPTSGSGTTVITYTLTRNDTNVEREAAITIAGLRYRISQDGCLAPESGRYPAIVTATVGSNLTINPLVAPFDDGVLTVTSPSTNGGGVVFTGTAEVDNGGQIRLRRLGPVGTFVITQNISDDCGNTGGSPIFTLNIVPAGQPVSPTISTFSPLSADIGNTLTVTGNNFVADETTIFFGDVAAPATVVSPTQLTVTVPDGAFGGPLQVFTRRGSAASAQSFSVDDSGEPPTITGLDRASASVGQTVTVSGTNFVDGATQFRLSEGQVVNPQVTGSDSASFTVSSGAITGPVTVLTPAGSAKSTANLISLNTVGQNCPRPFSSVTVTVGSTAVDPGQTAVIPIDFSQVCPGQGGNALQFDIALNAAVVNMAGPFGVQPGPAIPAPLVGNLTVTPHPTNPHAVRVNLPNTDPSLSFATGRFCTLSIPTLAPPAGVTFGASLVQLRNDGILNTFVIQIGDGPIQIGSTSANGGDISGTITVAPGAGCGVQLGATTASAPGGASTGSFALTAPGGCAWEALSNATWITFPVTPTGAGSGTIQYAVALNPGAARSGTIAIAGQTFTINQAARGLASVGAFRPSNGFVYLRNSNTAGFADREFFYGQAGDRPVVGDWDGNGTDTIGIYRNGTFFLRNSNSSGFADLQFPFGGPGDLPIAGDWDGDGVDTIGIVRGNQVFLRNSNTAGNADLQFPYGTSGDTLIAGDWNGDGVDTIGAFRPTNGFVYLRNTNTGGFADIQFFYGQASDVPVVSDWNGDGADTIGIVRNAEWFLRNTNTSGFADLQFFYGVSTDIPIAGNWTGQP